MIRSFIEDAARAPSPDGAALELTMTARSEGYGLDVAVFAVGSYMFRQARLTSESTCYTGFFFKKILFDRFLKCCNSTTSRWIFTFDPGNES